MTTNRNALRRNALAAAAALACTLTAHAIELDGPDPDTKIRLDFTPKYSAAYRLKNPSPGLTSPAANGDGGVVDENDGDLNFKKGVVSNRLDLLTEFDVAGKQWGLRVSHAAWYDTHYLRHNDNDGSLAVNNLPGQASDEFLPFTRKQHGRGDQLLDAFVYFKGSLGDMPGSLRIGKHALQYGESLFFGQNGIAAAQGPVDVAKILSVPNWQFKEVLLPVEQVSGNLQIADGLSVGGYYQFKWRPSKIPGVGSYFSNQDYIGGGRVYFGPPLPPMIVTDPSKDQTPRNRGQFGGQIRWSPKGSEYEFGLYAARYHEKTPSSLDFDLINGNVHTTYAQGVKTVGASVTSSVGQLNWALEGSLRWDAPLTGDPAVLGGAPFMPPANCDGTAANPCYAIGRTAHLNLSGIYVLQKGPLWDGGALLAELAWNRTLSVTKNPSAVGFGGLDPNTTRDAMALRMIFEPQYFQVAPGLDLSVPLGLGYNFGGRSSAIFNFAGGVSQAGDFTVGIKGKYQTVWNVGLTYTGFFGKEATFTVADPSTPTRMLSFGQSLKDRNYLAFTVSRTF
jgi:hypothetical protein